MELNQIFGLIHYSENWELIFRDFVSYDQRQFLISSSIGVAFKLYAFSILEEPKQ